jgi:hypothetical protein
LSSAQRRSISNPIKRGRGTAQRSTTQRGPAQAVQFVISAPDCHKETDVPMGLVLLRLPAGGGPTDKTKHTATGAESRTLIVSQTQFSRFHRLFDSVLQDATSGYYALCSLLPSYAPWRSALVSSGAEAGQCEPAISQCTPLSALGQCSGSPAAKNTHTPNRVEKEILRDPGLGLGRYCFEGYNANEVTAILALPAWHAPHSHLPIRCSRCRLHIISRLPLRRR